LMSRWLLRATSRGVGSFLNSLRWWIKPQLRSGGAVSAAGRLRRRLASGVQRQQGCSGAAVVSCAFENIHELVHALQARVYLPKADMVTANCCGVLAERQNKVLL